MSQRNETVLKARITWDGEELPGFVSISEQKWSQGEVEVPEFKRKRKLPNGVTEFADLTLVYAVQRNSPTDAFFQQMWNNAEQHNLMRIETDAQGAETGRVLNEDCQLLDYTRPEIDLASPSYNKLTVVVCIWEATPLAAEA